jgi:hypothetical protein
MITPEQSKFPGMMLKAWAQFSQSGTVITVNKSFNVTSITRPSVGQHNITLTTPLSSATKGLVVAVGGVGGSAVRADGSQASASICYVISSNPVTYAATDLTTCYVEIYE